MSRRRDVLAAMATTVVPIGLALGVALSIVALSGRPVGRTASAFLDGAFGSGDAVAATLNTTVPLALIGVAWIVANAGSQINLGFEGQILAGGVGATLVGTKVTGLPAAIHLPLALTAGALGGALFASLPALLSVYRNSSELLSTFMLNFVAMLGVSWLVRGPLQDPANASLLQSSPVESSASWPTVAASQLSWDIVLVPLLVALVALVLGRTTLGFRLRFLSANSRAAKEAGVPTARLGAQALLASAAIAGVVGASLILASTGGVLTDGFSNGYGFLGIAVALLARNRATGCIAAGLLFAALQQGGALVETRVGVSSSLVSAAEGVVLIVLAGSAVVTVTLQSRAGVADRAVTTQGR